MSKDKNKKENLGGSYKFIIAKKYKKQRLEEIKTTIGVKRNKD